MLKKIDVLLPDASLYDVAFHFTRKLFEALERAGFICRLLEGNNRFLIPLDSPPDCTICFNGALKIDDGRLFCELIRIPHITFLLDPPFHFNGLTSSHYVVAGCDDRSGCEYLRDLKFPNAFFMPHAVEKGIETDPQVKRIYDVVMLATFVDCEKRRTAWKTKFPEHIRKGMEEAAAITLQDEESSFLDALKYALSPHLDWQDRSKMDSSFYRTIFSEVEHYIKGRDKLDLLDAVRDSQVHVFGSSIDEQGWKNYCSGRANVTVHPGVSYLEALKIMQQSKIVLNSCIKNKYGAHERIFSGSASGAALVTNDNVFLRENFVAGEEMVLYRRSSFNEVNGMIRRLLSDEAQRKEMAEKARQKVIARHTWDHRIARIIPEITPMIEQMTGST